MLVVIAILYDLARRIGVPYPTLLVLGGLALAFIPGLPKIELQPDLVLLVFLPPLLFQAAVDSPTRDLRTNLAPLLRLSIGLVLFTMVVVAAVAHAVIPGLGLGPGVRPRGHRRADRCPRRHVGLPPDRRAAPGRDPRRGRVALQRRDGARQLSHGGPRGRRHVRPEHALRDLPRGGRRRDRRGRRRRMARRRAPAPARQPAGRGRDLVRGPVRRLPAGRAAGDLGRPRRGHRRPDHRQPARARSSRRAAGSCG